MSDSLKLSPEQVELFKELEILNQKVFLKRKLSIVEYKRRRAILVLFGLSEAKQ